MDSILRGQHYLKWSIMMYYCPNWILFRCSPVGYVGAVDMLILES